MIQPHAQYGEVVDVRPLGPELLNQKTHVLAKSDDAELIRLVLPAGREIPTHTAPGQIIVQCLEGRVAFKTMGSEQVLNPGQLLFLAPNEPHAVHAIENCSVLLTKLLPKA